MGRRKDETEEQYQKRLRWVEKERKALYWMPAVWIGLIVLFFVYFIFFYEGWQDPRHPPDPPKPSYQGW